VFRGLTRAHRGAGDDPVRRSAQPRDVARELGGLAVTELGQRIVSRPAVVGAARGLAVTGQEQADLLHARIVRNGAGRRRAPCRRQGLPFAP